MRPPAGVIRGGEVTSDVSVVCDTVVVGSGAGGATVAAELAEAGRDVVLVEEGGYHSTGEFGASSVGALRTLYRDGGGGMTLGRPSVLYAEGRCVGGSTVVNGGMAWRTPSRVLSEWAARDGIRGIAEADMAPCFDEIETRLNVGQQDPETIGTDGLLLRKGADALGWRIVGNRRNQIHCAGSNNCPNGCPTGAKQSMLVTSIPRALRAGTRLYTDCRVTRIVRSADGRARGIVGRLPHARLLVRAATVVVAAGAIQTPVLLLRSGVRHPMLGRNLSLHPNANVIAYFDEDVTGWHGVHQAFQVREFIDDGIILTANNLAPPMLAGMMPAHGAELGDLMAGYNHVVTAGPLVEDTGAGRVRVVPGLGPQVSYRLAARTGRRLLRGLELTAEAMFAAGARRILLPVEGAPPVTSTAAARTFLRGPVPSRALRLYSIHLMGTVRMSEDPRRGVTDSFGQVRGVPGLVVCDASLFPGPTGLNPMETVIALALRNARHLITRR
ncbi:MAG TPA: GMC family oxidoreductase [Streptosporangiaceae bacterium]|nr:GMC family oxidoreductase [Streptosporangiaceae bacterium]